VLRGHRISKQEREQPVQQPTGCRRRAPGDGAAGRTAAPSTAASSLLGFRPRGALGPPVRSGRPEEGGAGGRTAAFPPAGGASSLLGLSDGGALLAEGRSGRQMGGLPARRRGPAEAGMRPSARLGGHRGGGRRSRGSCVS
jgi:hypothetical protein